MNVNIHEAKTHLSRLVQAVERGEEVIICRHGNPVARLIPYQPISRPIGTWEGQGCIAEDFNTLPEDIEDAFYGDTD